MKTRTIVAALVLSSASFPAAAQSDPNRCSAQEPSFCLNGVSNAVTALDSLRVALPGGRERAEQDDERKLRKRAASRRIIVAAADKVAGLGAPDPWGFWVSYGRSRYDGSVPVAPYDADLDTVRLGVDRFLGGRYLLGLALLVERLDTRTRYNGGGQDVDGATVAPYFSWLIDDRFSLDLNAGYGTSDATQNRIDPTSAPGAPSILRASYDARRSFASATLNALTSRGEWSLGGRAGLLHSEEKQDGFTETGGPSARTVRGRTVRLGQFFLGGDAAYAFGNGLEAQAALVYRKDVKRNDGRDGGGLPAAVGATQPDDKDEWEWSLGLRYFARRNVTLAIEYLRTEGRERFDHEALNLLVRLEY